MLDKNDPFWEASGPIPFSPLNDLVFKLLLQTSAPTLRGLVGSLLHLRDEEIKSIEVINPYEPADIIYGKLFILDVKVALNDDTIIGLEMQVLNEGDWPDRSLSYLCRSFDNLNRGDDYTEVKAAYHIGFLDFTLFPDAEPEFYAIHKLCNVRTGQIYNDKFSLGVVNLRQIDLATEEDRLWKIDEWARLFKATTWEELHMIAQSNPRMENACKRIHVMSADEIKQEQLENQRWYESKMRYYKKTLQERDMEVQELSAEIKELKAAIAALQSQQNT